MKDLQVKEAIDVIAKLVQAAGAEPTCLTGFFSAVDVPPQMRPFLTLLGPPLMESMPPL